MKNPYKRQQQDKIDRAFDDLTCFLLNQSLDFIEDSSRDSFWGSIYYPIFDHIENSIRNTIYNSLNNRRRGSENIQAIKII
jgi:hypothetical protein